jgi:hypothetical protein
LRSLLHAEFKRREFRGKVMQARTYEKPVVADYGDLMTLTQSTGFRGPEDGASKLLEAIPHHSGPLT